MNSSQICSSSVADNISSMFIPNKEQTEALARLFIPEIKMFFSDERTQKKYNEWKEKQNHNVITN